jgi:hypothetical protein
MSQSFSGIPQICSCVSLRIATRVELRSVQNCTSHLLFWIPVGVKPTYIAEHKLPHTSTKRSCSPPTSLATSTQISCAFLVQPFASSCLHDKQTRPHLLHCPVVHCCQRLSFQRPVTARALPSYSRKDGSPFPTISTRNAALDNISACTIAR